MNRKKRREFTKKAKEKGVPEEYIKSYITMLNNKNNDSSIPDGTKIMLDVNKIRSGKNYERMLPEYKAFVESSKDRVFTAHVKEGGLIELEEETKWLFWPGDLKKI